MRIGLDILYENPKKSTGTVTYLQGFLKALSDIAIPEHRLFLFANPSCIDFCREYADRYDHIIIPFTNHNRVTRTIIQLFALPFYSKELKLDVVNFLGTTGAFINSCATVQHVKTFHHLLFPDSLDHLKVLFLKTMLKFSVKKADLLIANSEYTRNSLIDLLNINKKKIVLINEAVDHSLFFRNNSDNTYLRTIKTYDVSRPYILFVSTLWPYKNVEILIKALPFSSENHDLVIIGHLPDKDYGKYLHKLIESLNLTNRVKMIGHIDNRRIIRDFYLGADLYVLPSLAETFGLTVLEAMACGTPVIASNSTSIPEIAGDAALLFNPYDYKDLSALIKQVLNNPNLKMDMITSGLNTAQNYNWRLTAEATLKAYQLSQLLKNAKGQSFSADQ